jgi:hypothetical protein
LSRVQLCFEVTGKARTLLRAFTGIVCLEVPMQPMTPLFGSQKSDPQTIRQWAAEDFAINIGWP